MLAELIREYEKISCTHVSMTEGDKKTQRGKKTFEYLNLFFKCYKKHDM
jgi:hypothetical protein